MRQGKLFIGWAACVFLITKLAIATDTDFDNDEKWKGNVVHRHEALVSRIGGKDRTVGILWSVTKVKGLG